MNDAISALLIIIMIVATGRLAYVKGRRDGCPEGGPGKPIPILPKIPQAPVPQPPSPVDLWVWDPPARKLEKVNA